MKKVTVACVLAGLSIGQIALADNFTIGAYCSDWSKASAKKAFIQQLVSGLNSLHAQTGDSFKLAKFATPQELGQAVADGKVDVAYGKLETYFYAKQVDPNTKILLIPYAGEKSNITYAADFITLKSNTNINTWQDLQNKRFVFMDKYSLSGFVYPVAFLKSQGKDFRQFFQTYSFAGEHENVMRTILAGKADAGTTWDDLYQHAPNHDKFKIVYQIKNIPNPPITGSGKLTSAQIKKIQRDFVMLPSKSLSLIYSTGFTVDIPSSFYADARKKVQQVQAMSQKLVE